MILYNITIIIDDSINTEWQEWINNYFIPGVMGTGLFASSRLLKVLESPNEGITYCLQFISDNISSYHQFKKEHEQPILQQHSAQFAEKFVSFNTLMEFVD